MEFHLKIIGVLFIVLSGIHIGFAKYFNWKSELLNLSLINRQMMQTHTFFIALTVFLMGVLCLFCPAELAETGFGKKICFGLAVFWTLRFFFQLFVYSPKLWKGKRFETAMHIVFTCFWVYVSGVFWMIAI
jgi:hypothetical protein